MLSEITQAVKQKYHMISPISGTYHTREQDRTRDMEVKNKQPVTREEGQGNNGGKEGEGSSQGTCIKDPWTRTTEGRIEWGR